MKKYFIWTVVLLSCFLTPRAQVWAMSDYDFSRLCEKGTYDEVATALKASADVNAKGENGNTALMWAVEKNPNPEVLSLVLKNGAHVNAKGNYGETALMRAAANPNPEVASLLLKNGANARVKNKKGKRAIDYAENNPKFKDPKALEELRQASQ
ncbi:MAG: ankyrin repeat domain-containing protein [Synergistaceae bacterium]|nr:ankyrin repeat domain-containing protein [Synergistaceae bacterium]